MDISINSGTSQKEVFLHKRREGSGFFSQNISCIFAGNVDLFYNGGVVFIRYTFVIIMLKHKYNNLLHERQKYIINIIIVQKRDEIMASRREYGGNGEKLA